MNTKTPSAKSVTVNLASEGIFELDPPPYMILDGGSNYKQLFIKVASKPSSEKTAKERIPSFGKSPKAILYKGRTRKIERKDDKRMYPDTKVFVVLLFYKACLLRNNKRQKAEDNTTPRTDEFVLIGLQKEIFYRKTKTPLSIETGQITFIDNGKSHTFKSIYRLYPSAESFTK